MNRQPTVREIVNLLAREGGWFSSRDVIARSGATRQAAHRELATLVRDGRLIAAGKARATRYRAAAAITVAVPAPAFERVYATAGLREDEVWREVAAALPALPARPTAHAVTAYALTEMVNNAIDHAGAARVAIRAGERGAERVIWFEVDDAGIGAFENVRAGLGLPDTLAALQEISKGKRSTQPERHSGEGIFFTSKLAAEFELAANGLTWLVDNRRGDHAIGVAPARPGTRVKVTVDLDRAERPEDVFARYTHDFEFDTTRTVVKLFAHGVRFVSRSEAKRLCEGLDRFRHVLIDFTGVEAVGQGFADEVFRVWANAHPDVELSPEHMSPPVAFMVGRARTAR